MTGRHDGSATIAIGVGCRKACPATDIVALVRTALARLPGAPEPAGLYTLESKRGEPGLVAAAATLGLPLVFLERDALETVAGAARSHSARIEAIYGLPCIAETAALAGAGCDAMLLVERLACATATCAIAGPGAPGPRAPGPGASGPGAPR